MIPLPWDPAWAHPGMSVWALACRIAHVSTATVKAVVAYLVGAHEHRRSVMLFRTPQAVTRLASALQLPLAQAEEAFADDWPTSLYEREHFRVGLRWCPKCLEAWYHSPSFQDDRVAKCPLHDVALLDRCPTCARVIDPLGQWAWTCTFCEKPLVASPGDRLADFKRHVPIVAARTGQIEQGASSGRLEQGALLVRRAVDAAVPRWPGDDSWWNHSAQYWRQLIVYEDGCALWDTLANSHRDCAAGEVESTMTQYVHRDFKCPVAAALLQAYAAVGVTSEPKAGWPRWRATEELSRLYDLGGSRTEAWLVPALMRELTRLMVLDALKTLGELAPTERGKTYWYFDPKLSSIDHTEASVILRGVASENELLKATAAAAACCPRFHTT